MKRFFYGAGLVFEGISFFYRERKLWKYVAGPVFILIVTYALSIWGILLLSQKLVRYSEALVAGWPEFLRNLISGSLFATALILCAIVIVTTVSTLFEIFGGLFFDALIHKFVRSQCPEKLGKSDWAFNFKAIVESIIYSTNTLFMIIALLLLNIFLPVLGQIIGVIVVSYRFGTAYLGMCGFHYRKTMRQTRTLARLNFMPVLGYGLSIYIIFLFPLAVIFTLPGLILGGVRLYDDITNS